MTGLVLAGIVVSLLVAALAVTVLVQRRQIRRLDEASEAGGLPVPDGRARLAEEMLAGLFEPALLHGETIIEVNSAFAALAGVPASALRGRKLSEFVAQDFAALVDLALQRHRVGAEAPALTECELVDPHGQVSRLELRGRSLETDAGRWVLVTAQEIFASSVRMVAPIRTERMQFAADSLGEGLITTDASGRIDYLNRAAEKMLGLRRADLGHERLGQLVSFVDELDRRVMPDPVQQCMSSGARSTLGRRALMVVQATGDEIGVDATATPIRGAEGEMAGVVVLLHDVSELRGLARQMSYQASHDALTGLVNRREFERRLAEAIELTRAARQAHVMCYLDLDRFKAVNDTSGHLAGDNMLREVAALLREAVRDSDTVGRLGGDEFGVLLIGCPLDKARQISDDICRAVNDYRFVWKDRIFTVGVSIGLVEVTREATGLEEVMNAADSACYAAKNQNGGSHVHVYSSRDEAVARGRGEIQWLQRLQAALRDGQFELYVQPIEPAAQGTSDGPAVEVFVRLRDEEGRTVSPAEFLPAAERYRLVSQIDRWVLHSALSAIASGAVRLPAGRSLALNVSGQTLGDPGFLEFVVDELDRSGVSPAQLCFEVAENAVSGNLEPAQRFIGVLHGMGCRFALDDFGDDLGAFSNLRQLPMDFLKIDGSFMRDLAHDSVNRAMVGAVISMARSLKIRLIAEQVEDVAALEAARALGIDFVQGYAVGRPQALRQ